MPITYLHALSHPLALPFPQHSYLSRIIKADEGAPQLTECLLDGGLIEPSLLRFFSGHFAQAAITSAGVQEDDPVSLLRKLLPTGAATLDYTRDRSILAPLRTTTTATVGANGRSSGSQDPSPKFCTPPYAELADKPQDVDPLLDWQRTMTEVSAVDRTLLVVVEPQEVTTVSSSCACVFERMMSLPPHTLPSLPPSTHSRPPTASTSSTRRWATRRPPCATGRCRTCSTRTPQSAPPCSGRTAG